MKLQFLLVHPTHYYAFFLSHLQAAIGKQVDIDVEYLDEVNSLYPWTSNFRKGYKSNVSKGSFFKKYLINKIVKGSDTVFILVGWERLDKLFLIMLLSLFRRKYLVYTDTPDTFKDRSPLKDFIRNLVLRFISTSAYGIIVTGEIGVKKVNEWPFKFRNVINLPFFVDLSYFKPKTLEVPNDKSDHLIFFSSGRLINSHKGFDLAIEAFGKLKKAGKITAFSYIIAGEGADRATLQQLIARNDLSKEVSLLGWTEPDKLLECYTSSHVFLHPSHFDPYPNAVLEAMACGMAIIASDRAGSAIDRITDGANGYLFPSGNVDELMEKILALSGNRALITQFGKAARENAEQWPVDVGIKVIQEILEAKPAM